MIRPRVDRRLTDEQRELVGRHTALVGLIFRLPRLSTMALAVGSSHDAQQIAFLGIMRAAQLFDPAKGRFSTFAVAHMRSALAQAVRHANRKSRRAAGQRFGLRTLATLPDNNAAPADGEPPFDRSAWLDQALRRLAGNERTIILLRREGLTLRQIADHVGVTHQRVHQVYNRTIKKMQIWAVRTLESTE